MENIEANNTTNTLKLVEAYDLAYKTRNVEIHLFWQRSNYFLVLNTAIITGITLKLGAADPLGAIFIAFGGFVSFLWYKVNLGSKFWQSRWEQRLHDIEKEISPNPKLFSTDLEGIIEDVRKSMKIEGKGWWYKFINKKTLKKPSVSRHMISLSIGFMLLYIALFIIWLMNIGKNNVV